MKLCVYESFYQPVRNDLKGLNILEVNSPSSQFIRNVVVLDVNVLCLSIMDGLRQFEDLFFSISSDFEAKVEADWPYISHLECYNKLSLYSCYYTRIFDPHNHDIIYKNADNRSIDFG